MNDTASEAGSPPEGTAAPSATALSAIGEQPIKHILEAALLAADGPLSMAQMKSLFEEPAQTGTQPGTADIGRALEELAADCADRGVELKEVASGFRLQVKPQLQEWVARLWTERPPRYSRALMETLALIAYRQPITRGEIESVRGVSLSSSIIRTLQEREWIRIVGHRDVPGKPALFGTSKAFLDYFNLKSLDELPTLAELRDMETLEPQLEFEGPGDDGQPAEAEAASEGGPERESQPEADPEAHPDAEPEAEAEAEPEADSGDPPEDEDRPDP